MSRCAGGRGWGFGTGYQSCIRRHRSHSPLIKSIYTRMGIATNVPDEAINERNVESINVLHYGVGAECEAQNGISVEQAALFSFFSPRG